MAECLFCSIEDERVIAFNAHAYAIRDGFPVTEGHTLIIPKRHVEDYFGLTEDEILACDELLKEVREDLQISYPNIAGFNIGVNAGKAAGQTIFHCHTHLIPRRVGDVEDPRGGVRHVIPGKGFY
jgi:diadenosine tetraphosphate (Ap4A) HIT family hydrolase